VRSGEKHGEPNVSPESGRSVRAARIARLLAVGLLLSAAVAAFVLSLIPYTTLKDHVDAFSVDRDANVSRAEFADIVARLRILAAGFTALSVTLVAAGRRVDRTTTAVAAGWWHAIRRSPPRLRAWLGSESAVCLVALGVAIGTAVVVRIVFLDVPLRYDEATTYDNYVSKPLYVALANYSSPNNHLLNTFLAKASVTAFGSATWAIRMPALLAGIALVPATFAFARALYGEAAALLAAALVVGSSTLVEYSTNARGYTLVALLSLVAFLAAARVLENGSLAAWGLVAASSALALYAVPIALYPVGGVFLWLFVSRAAQRQPLGPFVRRMLWCGVATVVLTLLLYTPVFAASGVRSVTSNEFVQPHSWSAFFDRLPRHLWDTVETWRRDLPNPVVAVLACGLVASLVLSRRVSRFPVPPLLAIVVWTVPVLALQRVVPFTRVWLFLVPLVLAAAAAFYGWLLERSPYGTRLAAAVSIIVAVGAGSLVVRADSVRDSRETGALLDAVPVAAYLAHEVHSSDRILATGSDTILEYYLGRDGIGAGPLLYTDRSSRRIFVVVNVLGNQTIGELAQQLGPARERYGKPRLVKSYPSARVYLLERRLALQP
jgi:Dolichyl-phosphate-mannose-protein mannosyltransferase